MGLSSIRWSLMLLLALGLVEVIPMATPKPADMTLDKPDDISAATAGAANVDSPKSDPIPGPPVDPGWMVRNFQLSSGPFWQLLFALQHLGSGMETLCLADQRSPKDDWIHCIVLLPQMPVEWVKFKFDAASHRLMLNETWGYSPDTIHETIYVSIGNATVDCPQGNAPCYKSGFKVEGVIESSWPSALDE
ncbi:hypothetical protein PG990_000061 [Apiospora arundinis]